jgi:hypothetical protein
MWRGLAIASVVVAGCAADEEAGSASQAATACTLDPASYTPYALDGTYPSGAVAELPWVEGNVETFEEYPAPATVECANDKARRTQLDVTAGCLETRAMGAGAYTRAIVRATADGAFRAVALGHGADPALADKWTDQSIEYRFHYKAATGTENRPGFKAFVRYRSEDDLYVASWRLDGVVQIQEKRCGAYTALAVAHREPPSPGVWHRLRFDAIGTELALYLDDALVLTATSATFSWGTAGIRIDGADGAYLDDWVVD